MTTSPTERAESNHRKWSRAYYVCVALAGVFCASLLIENMELPHEGVSATDASLLGLLGLSFGAIVYANIKADKWADQARQLGF